MDVFWTPNKQHCFDGKKERKNKRKHWEIVEATIFNLNRKYTIPNLKPYGISIHRRFNYYFFLAECLSWDVLCYYRSYINSSIRRSFSWDTEFIHDSCKYPRATYFQQLGVCIKVYYIWNVPCFGIALKTHEGHI